MASIGGVAANAYSIAPSTSGVYGKTSDKGLNGTRILDEMLGKTCNASTNELLIPIRLSM